MVDLHMTHILDHLRQDHQRFEALLVYLGGVMRSVEPEEAIDYSELVALMTYLRPGLSGHHCAEERVIWNQLDKRTGSPRLVVEVLNVLHRSVVDKGASLETAALAALDGIAVSTDDLKSLANTFIAEFHKQIALEERAIFPLVNGVLHEDDWHTIEATVRVGIDYGSGRSDG